MALGVDELTDKSKLGVNAMRIRLRIQFVFIAPMFPLFFLFADNYTSKS